MPRFDGTGPRGAGMFTGRAEGYCALRLPEAGSNEPAIGHAGIEGRPVRLATDVGRPLASAGADIHARSTDGLSGEARRCRFGKRRGESR
jgi:hypothetical protein